MRVSRYFPDWISDTQSEIEDEEDHDEYMHRQLNLGNALAKYAFTLEEIGVSEEDVRTIIDMFRNKDMFPCPQAKEFLKYWENGKYILLVTEQANSVDPA